MKQRTLAITAQNDALLNAERTLIGVNQFGLKSTRWIVANSIVGAKKIQRKTRGTLGFNGSGFKTSGYSDDNKSNYRIKVLDYVEEIKITCHY